MTYEATESDIQWVQNMIGMLKDGGVWVCPCTLTIFTFFHTQKVYKMMGEDHPVNAITMEILERLGWTHEEDDSRSGGKDEG